MVLGIIYSQNIIVIEKKILLEKDGNLEYCFPKFSPQGDKVLCTSVGYQGLWLYNLSTNNIKNLNNYKGAGYNPVFSKDGKEVFFRHDKLIKKRRYFSIAHQSVNSNEVKNLVSNERDISTPKSLSDKVIVYKQNNKQVIFSFKDGNNICLLKKPVTDVINAFTENSNLYIEKNGEKSILNPVGEGHYIWGSLSPNRDKVLFTLAGKATYITSLEGNVLLELENANYPSWSGDGNWIVFMNDNDDGHVVTSSEIKVAHVVSKKVFNLTSSTNKIEMYPSWSPSDNKILYQTVSGNIEMLTVEVQE